MSRPDLYEFILVSALLVGSRGASRGITIVRIPDQVLRRLRQFRLLAADNLEDFSR
jgi:hypothetical protein